VKSSEPLTDARASFAWWSGVVLGISSAALALVVYRRGDSTVPLRLLSASVVAALAAVAALTRLLRIATRGLKSAPGSTAIGLIATIYSPKTRSRVFEPIVADMQKEYFDALAEEASLVRRFFILFRGYGALLIAAFPQALWSIAKTAVSIAKGKLP
jgi:hypothetical protein